MSHVVSVLTFATVGSWEVCSFFV